MFPILQSRPASARASSYIAPAGRENKGSSTLPILSNKTSIPPFADLSRIEETSPKNCFITPSSILPPIPKSSSRPHTGLKATRNINPCSTALPGIATSASFLMTTQVSTTLASSTTHLRSSTPSSSSAARKYSSSNSTSSDTDAPEHPTPVLAEAPKNAGTTLTSSEIEAPKTPVPSLSIEPPEAPKTIATSRSTIITPEVIAQIQKVASGTELFLGDERLHIQFKNEESPRLTDAQIRVLCTHLVKWRGSDKNFENINIDPNYTIHFSKSQESHTLFITRKDTIPNCGGSKSFRKCLSITIHDNDTVSTKWVGQSMPRPDHPHKAFLINEIKKEVQLILAHQDKNPIMCRILAFHEYQDNNSPNFVIYSELYPLDWSMVPREAHFDIFQQLIVGLNKLNKKGFYHCDLKLSNIVVRRASNGKYEVAIIDWGSASSPEYKTYTIRDPQFFKSSPKPPLLFDSNNQPVFDPRHRVPTSPSEVWSLGCVLYRLHYGIEPRWSYYETIYFQLEELYKKMFVVAKTPLPAKKEHSNLSQSDAEAIKTLQKTQAQNLCNLIGFNIDQLLWYSSVFITSFNHRNLPGLENDDTFLSYYSKVFHALSVALQDEYFHTKADKNWILKLRNRVYSAFKKGWTFLETAEFSDEVPALDPSRLIWSMLRPTIGVRIGLTQAELIIAEMIKTQPAPKS